MSRRRFVRATPHLSASIKTDHCYLAIPSLQIHTRDYSVSK